ncbi:acyl-CoA dehydrogenase family protein [Phytohabitans kaempferiae]|uniref:Acyl-CoA dehydrogenase family protein n=1 Tax=Phytohabitans kaempferiae TaxID=1620943 RepID=A0ABV6LXZ1_9ACTN
MTVTSEEDLEEFRDSVRGALSEASTSAKVRAAMATPRGWDERTWRLLGGQLGLAGLMLPEDAGGAGLGLAELSVAIEECGAHLACAPLFATAVLAVPLLLAVEDAAQLKRYGPPIAGGRLTATVALAEAGARWDVATMATTATPDRDGWRLDGTKHHVVDGAAADLVLVVAGTEDGPGVFAVESGAPGLRPEPLVTLDQTRKMARLHLDGVPAKIVGAPGCDAALAAAADMSRTLLAAEQTGVAQRSLDTVVEYVKTRIQFARPIGSFQAIKQRLADALIQVESARSGVYTAARSTGADLARNSRLAALVAAEAATWMTAQAIQLHGGIGFTWEHDAHLYFKRARVNAILLGTVGEHVAALGAILDHEIS